MTQSKAGAVTLRTQGQIFSTHTSKLDMARCSSVTLVQEGRRQGESRSSLILTSQSSHHRMVSSLTDSF